MLQIIPCNFVNRKPCWKLQVCVSFLMSAGGLTSTSSCIFFCWREGRFSAKKLTRNKELTCDGLTVLHVGLLYCISLTRPQNSVWANIDVRKTWQAQEKKKDFLPGNILSSRESTMYICSHLEIRFEDFNVMFPFIILHVMDDMMDKNVDVIFF